MGRVVDDLSVIQAIQFRRSYVGYASHPVTKEVLEVTAANADSVAVLIAHCYADKFPELFEGFNRDESQVPTLEELQNTSGLPLGSIDGLAFDL